MALVGPGHFSTDHPAGEDDTMQWRGPTAVVIVCLAEILAILCFPRKVWRAWPKGRSAHASNP
jgi:hypothetical protein